MALTYERDASILTIFVYNGGVGDIPIGIDTVVALKQFEQAKLDVLASSIPYVTTGRNTFYKARLTTPAGSPLLESEAMAQLRRDLGDFIVPLILR